MAPLDTDGFCGPLTAGAIRTFQQKNGCIIDGRVDVNGKTFNTLNQYDLAGPGITPSGPTPIPIPLPNLPAPKPPSSNASDLRQRIIDIANSMAAPAPGKVSDLVTTIEAGRTVRAGWPYLKSFFDEAVAGWQQSNWNDKATLDGVKVPGKRIPQPGRDGVSWCGIFATWVLIQAGLPVKWVLGKGIVPLQLKFGRDARPGDVVVLSGNEVHHCIPTSIDGQTMQTVNGNSDNQSILVKPIPVSRIAYYYNVGD